MISYFISSIFFCKIFKYEIFKNINLSNNFLNLSFLFLVFFYFFKIENNQVNFVFLIISIITSSLNLSLHYFIKKDYNEFGFINLFSLFSIFNFFIFLFNIFFIFFIFFEKNIIDKNYILIYILFLVLYLFLNMFSIVDKHEKLKIFKINIEYEIKKINLDFNYLFEFKNLFVSKNAIYFYINDLKVHVFGRNSIYVSISNNNGFIYRIELIELLSKLSKHNISLSELNADYLKLFSISEY